MNFSEEVKTELWDLIDEMSQNKFNLNYKFAIHICRYFISKMAEKSPPDVEVLISKEILPVRPGRHDPHKVTPKKVVSFLYRIA